nr:glycoside hydrolase family 127 protein [Ardenticatenia bacterium]
MCCCSSSIPRGIALIAEFTAGTIGNQPALLLYKPGTYNIKNAGTTVQLKVETAYPKTGTVAITVASPQRTQFPLALHVPSWCDDFEAVVHEQRYQGRSGSLLIIDRTWQPGDQVKIHMDMSFKVLDGGESYPDKMALQRGPQVLATDSTVSDNGGKLPSREWFGDQLYPIRGVTPGGMEQKLAMVPFAEAGQAWGDYEVWINKLTLSRNTRQLDPVGKVHIPIGIPNSLDSLKTFVEAEGNFSPGIGSYGIYFWVFDPARDRLTAPTSEEVQCTHGLVEDRLLIPWSQWSTGAVDVRTDVCAVKRVHAQGDVYLVGARAHLTNTGDQPKRVSLYVALRPLGPAGFDVQKLTVGSEGDALLADGHSALVANTRPSAAGVLPTDTIGNMALRGGIPKAQSSASEKGDCSGALRFELEIPAGRTETVELVCPVHPGRRAVRHQWTPRTTNYVDIAVPHSNADGIDIPDLGLDCYHGITAGDLFQQARDDWHRFYSRVALDLPEARWTNGFYVMLAHAGLCMNEGAADVAVLNYTVFNRDGMYIANMMQKAGLPRMSEAVIDYFLAHPFNGRPYPEADNPGQVLWSMGQHWKLTGDRIWLQGIYPSAKKIAEMIKYYRNTQGPYWVNLDSLEYGEALSQDERLELKPGRCDGFHPEYTEAFDIAGLRVVGDLAEAMGQAQEAQQWR